MNEKGVASLGGTILRWILWAVVLFVFLGFLLPFRVLPLQLLYLIFLGWIPHLLRVLPQIAVNAEIAFDAAVALALGLFGLHHLLMAWARHRGAERAPWRFAWTLKISVMVLLLFATSIAAVGFVHQFGWLCQEPRLIHDLSRGPYTREMSNLKQVVTALELFAEDHGGKFPQTLEELVPDVLPTYDMLFTSSRDGDPPQPIIYYAGYSMRDDETTIVVASPRPFETAQGHTRVVVHRDRSGEVIPESRFQELVQKQLSPVREH